MIYLLILAYWIYFIGEGYTEGLTWKANWTSYKINPRTYHIWRLVENLGVTGALFITYYCHPENWLIVSLLAAVSGLVIYERLFCLARYDDFLYQKTSKWFGVTHPPVGLELILFTLSVIMILTLTI